MDLFAAELTFDAPTALAVAVGVFAFTFVRYVVVSGLYYLIAYHWLRDWFQPHKLNPRHPDRAQLWGEFKLGTANLVNFSLFAVLILYLYTGGHTRVYAEVDGALGVAYLLASLLALFVIQDAYFYWIHRLLHWKPLMKWAHAPHHRFRNPSPFAAFAVHPAEGFLEVAYRPLILCVLPLHPVTIAAYVVLSFVINAGGHGGIELYRSGWSRHWFFQYLGSASHHYVHHKYVNKNFSLYFTWWDKWMGTEHAAFHEEFERAAVKPQPAPRLSGRVVFGRPAEPRGVRPIRAGSASARLAYRG